jgi:hypothetical protein
MGQEMLPQKGGGDAAENDFYARIDLFGDPGDVDAAPAIGLENGKSDDIGRVLYQDTFDRFGGFMDAAPV